VETSRADRRRISATWLASRSGRTVQSQAAAPATIGDEKLVPDSGAQLSGRISATGMSTPGAARSTYGDWLENDAGWSRLIRRRDREHVWEVGRVGRRIALVAGVPGGGDDEAAEADRLRDRGVDPWVGLIRSQAEIDHGASGPRRRQDSRGDIGRGQARAVAERGVVRADHGVRVDPHEPDAVDGCADDRRDHGSVPPADRRGLLVVQRDEVRVTDELRVRELDAGVDEGQPGRRAQAV